MPHDEDDIFEGFAESGYTCPECWYAMKQYANDPTRRRTPAWVEDLCALGFLVISTALLWTWFRMLWELWPVAGACFALVVLAVVVAFVVMPVERVEPRL